MPPKKKARGVVSSSLSSTKALQAPPPEVTNGEAFEELMKDQSILEDFQMSDAATDHNLVMQQVGIAVIIMLW